jgi:serine/threonine protein kinase, bacterial
MEGTPFGRYRLIELLGRGGMGEVWQAYDTAIDRMVALKVLPANLADDPVFQERFRREAKAAAGLDEPHVVPIHDYGEIDGRLYVTMRLIKGRDLQTVLADGPLAPERAVRIVEQVAKALHAAHRIGLIHRDIKPSNILLAEDDFAYLIDFGIARAAGETGLTSTGAAIGTWAYMSPERLNTGHADARADIYALTCVLHEALTGQRPYPGDSLEQQIVGHLTRPPPRPSMLRPGVPQPLDAVIAKGMAKQPDQRYASTVELARAARDATTVPLPRPGPAVPVHSWSQPDLPVAGPIHSQDTRLAATGAPPGWQPPPGPPPLWVQPTPRRPMWQRPSVAIPALLAVALLIGVGGFAAVMISHRQVQPPSPTARPSQAPSPSAQSASPSQPSPPSQVVLPFTGLNRPGAVDVDTAGAVYVTDAGNDRVLKLAANSTTPTTLRLTPLANPVDVTVDSVGTVYVVDNNTVRKFTPGSTTGTELPFTGLYQPGAVAVDAAGAVYVADAGNNRVLKLSAGSTTPTELPFTGLNRPADVAVDAAGAVYVTDSRNNRVLKLPAGSTTPTELPFTGLNGPGAVAVDTAGAVYVVDDGNSRALRLAAGSTTPTELPFTGLNAPSDLAVDTSGNVYVTDRGNNRVLKLPVQ